MHALDPGRNSLTARLRSVLERVSSPGNMGDALDPLRKVSNVDNQRLPQATKHNASAPQTR